MGRVIAIANQKGGVGKTTTAINLGASLGAAEKKTLLIDIDPQANATSGCGITAGEKEIYHVLLGGTSLDEIIQQTASPNFFVASATVNLIGYEVEGIELENREQRLKKAISNLRNSYDYILIDCPPSLGLLTLNALCAADGVLVPLQSEYYALEGLGRLVGTIDLISQQLNSNLKLDGIVLTMFDKRNSLAHQVAAEVEKHFGEKVWKTQIPRNVRLSEAPSFGKPILLYDIRSVGAQSYLALADEFLNRFDERRSHERTESPREGDRVADTQPAPQSH